MDSKVTTGDSHFLEFIALWIPFLWVWADLWLVSNQQNMVKMMECHWHDCISHTSLHLSRVTLAHLLALKKEVVTWEDQPHGNDWKVVPIQQPAEKSEVNPTTAGNWILPTTHEPGRTHISPPDSTLMSACSDTEQKTQVACTQPPDAWKLWHHKWVFF